MAIDVGSLSAGALMISVMVGVLAGAAFFGGLYLTTRRLATASRPGVLVVSSFVARIGIVLGLAWVAALVAGHWGLIGYLVGITGARVALVAAVRRASE